MQARRHAGFFPAGVVRSNARGHAMAYYTKVLQPDERVKYVGKLHWIMYRYAILFGMFAIVAAILSMWLTDDQRFPVLIGSAILVALALIIFVRHLFHQWTTEIVVTDKRIIHKLYFIRRFTEEMNVTKVETVVVEQTILGRILGYGKVTVKGTGATLETLPYVASPLDLRSAIIVG
jgi:hypothetical protein